MGKNEQKPDIRIQGFTDPWEQRRLNEVGVVIDPHPSHRAPKEETGGIPFIGIGDVDEMGNINKESARPVSESVFEEHHKRYDLGIPSLGLGRVASLGKVIRLRPDIGKYAISPTMSVLQFKETVDIDYLYAFMNSAQFQMQFEGKSNGSTRQSVGTEMVRLLDLVIPSDKEEQKAIGMFHKNLDTLITLHRRKYDKLVNVKKSMLEKLFPRDGASVPEIRFAGFTDPWKQRKLGEEAIEILAGGDIDKEKAVEEGKYPIYANALTNDGIIGYYDDYFRVQAPAVTVTGRGEVGHAQARMTDFTPVVRLLAIRTNHDCYFLENAINNYKVVVESTGVPQLTVPQLSSYEICFPVDIEEEKKIGTYFHTLDTLITLHQRKLEKLKNIKKSMLEKMFV